MTDPAGGKEERRHKGRKDKEGKLEIEKKCPILITMSGLNITLERIGGREG